MGLKCCGVLVLSLWAPAEGDLLPLLLLVVLEAGVTKTRKRWWQGWSLVGRARRG